MSAENVPAAQHSPASQAARPDEPLSSGSARLIGIELVDGIVLTSECLALTLMHESPEFNVSTRPARSAKDSRTGDGPDVVLFNINDRHLRDPAVRDAVREQINLSPATPVIVIADCDDPLLVFEAVQIGARGYFPSVLAVPLLIAAIRLVLAGGLFLPPSVIRGPYDSTP